MILWRNIEIFPSFLILIPTPDFPHFYYMLGGNFGSLLYGDVSVMCGFCLERFPLSLGTWDGLRYFIVAFLEPSI